MTITQMLTGVFVGMLVLVIFITLITLFLKKFNSYYYKKMDESTERIYLHPLENSDIAIQDTLNELKRVNSFVQNQKKGDNK